MNIKNVEWVVKISKQCNLRCTYCYEFPFLGQAKRMSLDELRAMFFHIAQFYDGRDIRMDFVWHGGEPLIIEPNYYLKIREIQNEVFSDTTVSFTNSVQTNLTALNERVFELFQTGFFKNIGVSIDIFGDQRVNISGKQVQDKVLKNMQLLKDHHIPFGCITVLSRVTAPHIEKIYRFFETIDTSFRFLPIYRSGFEGQQDNLALSDYEIVECFKQVTDMWFASDSSIQVRPIQDYITNVVRTLDNVERSNFYDKEKDEVVYIVDTDGSLFSVADPPDPSLCHGNIFETPINELKKSFGYKSAVRAANNRMKLTCQSCEYYGVCSGYFIGEATPSQRNFDASGNLQCGVAQPVQDYIKKLILQSGMFDTETGKFVSPEDFIKKLQHTEGSTNV